MKLSRSSISVAMTMALVALHGPVHAGDNPPMPGFDAAGSDAHAMQLADRTMDAMGGRAAWDAARVIGWTIFKRTHVWDKWTGDYRLEADSTLVIMNINTTRGRVWEKGVEVTDAAKRDEILHEGLSIWINDAYWLLMPYKLKDSGVTLHDRGETTTADGRKADAVELTFRGVGDTPENKYIVCIDRETGLVSQWAYFQKAADAEPRFTLPWNEWTAFGGIKLATGRGKTEVTGIHVSTTADPAAFAAP